MNIDDDLEALLTPLGVVLEKAEPEQPSEQVAPIQVISIYEKRNEKIWKRVQQHLDLVAHHYQEQVRWQTYQLHTQAWMKTELPAILAQIEHVDLILLGVSVDFLSTLYQRCTSLHEWLLSLSQDQTPVLVPISLLPVSWQQEEIPACRPLVPYRRSVGGHARIDEACVEVANRVQEEIWERIWVRDKQNEQFS